MNFQDLQRAHTEPPKAQDIILLIPTFSFRLYLTMLRQIVSTSSRSLRTAQRASASKAFLRPQFQTAPAFTLRAVQPAASRWYSDAKETPAEGEKAGETPGESAESDVVAELKKALEAKDAEARDWKVR